MKRGLMWWGGGEEGDGVGGWRGIVERLEVEGWGVEVKVGARVEWVNSLVVVREGWS